MVGVCGNVCCEVCLIKLVCECMSKVQCLCHTYEKFCPCFLRSFLVVVVNISLVYGVEAVVNISLVYGEEAE